MVFGDALEVLLVDDEPVDALTFLRVVRRCSLDVELSVVESAESALENLRDGHARDAADASGPHLIVADLRLPRLSGLELLDRVKADPRLRRIPFVMLSTSTQESDVSTAYELGAAGYFVKPIRFDEFAATVEAIVAFYRRAVVDDGPRTPFGSPPGFGYPNSRKRDIRAHS